MARVDGRRIAWTVLRHAAPLLFLVSPETVVPYLVMALFDLGVGYAGQQLRHPAAASAHAHDCAETAVERLFASAQLPMLLLLSGILFVVTVALPMVPWMLDGRVAAVWSVLYDERGWLLLTALLTSWGAARQVDQVVRARGRKAYAPGQARALDHLLVLGLFVLVAAYALAAIGPMWSVWLLALLLTVAQCALDLGWRPISSRRY